MVLYAPGHHGNITRRQIEKKENERIRVQVSTIITAVLAKAG
jgi:hypothetical protein